jgi:hypothetical protein
MSAPGKRRSFAVDYGTSTKIPIADSERTSLLFGAVISAFPKSLILDLDQTRNHDARSRRPPVRSALQIARKHSNRASNPAGGLSVLSGHDFGWQHFSITQRCVTSEIRAPLSQNRPLSLS